MAKRDPNKTARNRRCKEISSELGRLWPQVSADSGYGNQLSFNALIGGKVATFIDLKEKVIKSADEYISEYLRGFKRARENEGWTAGGASFSAATLQENFDVLTKTKATKSYFLLFLQRAYLRHYDELVRTRPSAADSEIWIGENNSDYGILITPRFNPDGEWENDRSEIRRFPKLYWTIGHVLTTGMVVQGDPTPISFATIDNYLNFFTKVLVRSSGSKYEREIAALYCSYVRSQEKPEDVPLLIPELRYRGKEKRHKYRLDFCVIDPVTLEKVGFELSPWSSHGHIASTAKKNQKQINAEALKNFEKEAGKLRDYFRKHRITTLIYTDAQLADTCKIFDDMSRYFYRSTEVTQMEFSLIEEFL